MPELLGPQLPTACKFTEFTEAINAKKTLMA